MDNQRETFLKDLGYTDKAIGYIIGETNAGEIESPSAMARHQGHCGDIMILYLEVDKETGIIQDAKHRITGCAGLQAAAGAVTEMIRGKHVDETRSIDTAEIIDWLGGTFPDFKMDCVELARDTLREALETLSGGLVGESRDSS